MIELANLAKFHVIIEIVYVTFPLYKALNGSDIGVERRGITKTPSGWRLVNLLIRCETYSHRGRDLLGHNVLAYVICLFESLSFDARSWRYTALPISQYCLVKPKNIKTYLMSTKIFDSIYYRYNYDQ